MDGILGTRAASDPPIIVDSGAGPHTPEEDEDGKCNVMKHNLMRQQYVFYFVGPALDPLLMAYQIPNTRQLRHSRTHHECLSWMMMY